MGTPSVMAQPQVLTDTGRFVRAADGDTLTVQTDRHGLITVRLAGVDAPERDMRYAEEATRFLKAFVQSASLGLDCHSMDRYGRHVCEVRKGQQDLGAELIAAGLAWHFKRYASEQSSAHRDLYAKLETAARTKRLGLWADAQAMDPQACRKLKREGHACP
jgi:endonuclease YncB( thermonuclease family)